MVDQTRQLDSLLHASASEQARAVTAGCISAVGLLQMQMDAIDRYNPAINAYIERAVAPAPEPGDSPLAGSSFAVKDNFDVAGLPTASGLRVLAHMPAHDAPVVARLRNAGLVCLGKLNMHPMALGASNHNPDYGDCFNPLRPGFTPGGSSGGSGAAVAAGLCGLALGSDTMGSVRIPAAYCGVVGFKPSHESLGLQGVETLCRWLDHAGLMARSVEDIDIAMRICAPRLKPANRLAVTQLRVGVVRGLSALGASKAVSAAFDAAVDKVCRAFGWTVVPVELDRTVLGASRRAGLLLCEAELHPQLAALVREQPHALPADLLAMMRYIERKSAPDLGQALAQAARAGEQLDQISDNLDALLLPTAPQLAFAMQEAVPANQADFTAMANMNGAPAISLPLLAPRGGLPAGLQVVGHRGYDMDLLQLASALEQVLSNP